MCFPVRMLQAAAEMVLNAKSEGTIFWVVRIRGPTFRSNGCKLKPGQDWVLFVPYGVDVRSAPEEARGADILAVARPCQPSNQRKHRPSRRTESRGRRVVCLPQRVRTHTLSWGVSRPAVSLPSYVSRALCLAFFPPSLLFLSRAFWWKYRISRISSYRPAFTALSPRRRIRRRPGRRSRLWATTGGARTPMP